jgi:hypothetical protein
MHSANPFLSKMSDVGARESADCRGGASSDCPVDRRAYAAAGRSSRRACPAAARHSDTAISVERHPTSGRYEPRAHSDHDSYESTCAPGEHSGSIEKVSRRVVGAASLEDGSGPRSKSESDRNLPQASNYLGCTRMGQKTGISVRRSLRWSYPGCLSCIRTRWAGRAAHVCQRRRSRRILTRALLR